jgi:hypothetical protein
VEQAQLFGRPKKRVPLKLRPFFFRADALKRRIKDPALQAAKFHSWRTGFLLSKVT